MAIDEIQQDTISINSQKIHIDIYPANGKPIGTILFLHGNIVYAKSYRKFLSRLNEKGNFNVVSFDYIGWGRSEGQRGKAQANNILKQINEMVKYTTNRFPNSKYAVVGHSMGGQFAFEALIDNPVLYCCVSHTIRYPGTYANIIDRFFVNYFRFMGIITPNKRVSPLKEALKPKMNPGINTTYEKLLRDPRIVTTFDMKTIAELTKVKSNKDHKTQKPVLIIVGEKEENINEILLAKEAVRILPNSKLEIVKGSTHLLFIENPEKVADLIIDWLNKSLA
ncbi:MAG: hypothetical protein APF76_10415 [Desulfitibacter sp. BRH_c19]|nr:MAG: hypothetical protein APF76_10415 [Desulfitibacter sp. BRH_c19]